MPEKLLVILLDVLILLALGGTIFYLRRVIASIRIIREGRTELQKILQELNIHISNANGAIDGMRKLADEKGQQLQKQVNSAGAVIEELQYIQKAADNVAKRLESLTQQGATPLKTEEDKALPKPVGGISKAEQKLAEALDARRRARGE